MNNRFIFSVCLIVTLLTKSQALGQRVGGTLGGLTGNQDRVSWSYDEVDSGKSHVIFNSKSNITVAVIDTGLDLKHPALSGAIWINQGETGLDSKGLSKKNNGIDDDGNGFVDDVHGWNFARNNSDLRDTHGHGTHVSGIIASQENVISKVKGIAPNAKIMVIKYYDETCANCSTVRATLEGIKYAIKMGADIINYSSGGSQFSQEEKDVINEATKKGILFVAAAGNNSQNSDKTPYYPADYDLPGIISVAAVSPKRKLADISNFGKKSVDIAAPGDEIYSALPDYSAGFMTGTSQATAFVTGVAALTMGHIPSLRNSPELLKKQIVQTGRTMGSLSDVTKSGRIVNSYRALVMRGESDLTQTNYSFKDQNMTQLADLSGRLDEQSFSPGEVGSVRSFSSLLSPALGENEGQN